MCLIQPTEFLCDGVKHYDDVVVKRCHNKIIGSGCNPYSEETKRSRHTAQGSGYCEDCRNRLGLQDLPGRVPDANIGDEEQMRNAGHGGQGRYGQQASYGVDWGYNTTGGPSELGVTVGLRVRLELRCMVNMGDRLELGCIVDMGIRVELGCMVDMGVRLELVDMGVRVELGVRVGLRVQLELGYMVCTRSRVELGSRV